MTAQKCIPLFLLVILPILATSQQADTVHYPEEKHFRNIQQLTFGGDNAEAYFSYDSKWLIFQRTSVKDGPPLPDRSKYGNKYIWPLYSSYDIFMADRSVVQS